MLAVEEPVIFSFDSELSFKKAPGCDLVSEISLLIDNGLLTFLNITILIPLLAVKHLFALVLEPNCSLPAGLATRLKRKETARGAPVL